jgi:hypothetical protein
MVSDTGEDGVAVLVVVEMVSQEAPLVAAVKLREAPPVFRAYNCWVRAALPWVAVKLMF